MKPTAKQKFLKEVNRLIAESESLMRTQWEPGGNVIDFSAPYVEVRQFAQWETACRNLVHLMGDHASIWKQVFSVGHQNRLAIVKNLTGSLESLRDAIQNDLLTKVEDLVSADAFASLLEQADELLSKDYVLAAGVLGRAVLEEHLRKLCERHDCLPVNRPTINDLNQSLYKSGHLDKLGMQTVTAMATIGNDCAHNSTHHTAKDVGKFLSDVRDFLVRHALS